MTQQKIEIWFVGGTVFKGDGSGLEIFEILSKVQDFRFLVLGDTIINTQHILIIKIKDV